MLAFGHFLLAYVVFAIAGIWAVCYWLCSDYLTTLRKQTRNSIAVQNAAYAAKAKRTYRYWKYGGCVIMLAATIASEFLNRRTQVEAYLAKLEGRLYPGSEKVPHDGCNPTGKELAVYLDNYAVAIEDFPQVLLTIHGVPVLAMDRSADGGINLTMTLTSEDGRVVVKMDKGEFVVNPNNILRMRRPDTSHLIVDDQKGNEMLNIDYMNRQNLSIRARLYQGSTYYDLSKLSFISGGGICFKNEGHVHLESMIALGAMLP